MAKTKFCGNPGLGPIDDEIMSCISNNQISPYQALSLRIIKMSVKDYLYFGLGANGITAEAFLAAYQYITYIPLYKLVPKEIQEKYFSTHFYVSNLDQWIDKNLFISMIKQKRKYLVTKNFETIMENINLMREEEWDLLDTDSIPIDVRPPAKEVKQILTFPNDPVILAKVLCYQRPTTDKDTVCLPYGVCKSTPQYLSYLF